MVFVADEIQVVVDECQELKFNYKNKIFFYIDLCNNLQLVSHRCLLLQMLFDFDDVHVVLVQLNYY